MKNSVWNEKELSTLRNVDRLLPSQPFFSKMYNGNDFYGDLEKILFHPAKNWDIKTKEGMTYSVMGSDINTLHFYQFLIRFNRNPRVLELGTYIGVSAMYMADAGAEVTTVEKGREFYDIAYENVTKNWFAEKIELVNQDAIEFLQSDRNFYDFIFIDCAKESYKELLELSFKRLALSGLILIDDVFFQGDTLNDTPTTEKGKGVRAMLDYANSLEEWERVILPIGNGLLMMRRK